MKVLRLPARQRLVKLCDPLYAYFGAILITFSNDFTSYFQCNVESQEESDESEDDPEVLSSHIKCGHCDYWVIRSKYFLENHIQHDHKM